MIAEVNIFLTRNRKAAKSSEKKLEPGSILPIFYKQRKSLPGRRFGFVILIIIKFCELFTLRLINGPGSYVFEAMSSCSLETVFYQVSNTSKLDKKNWLRLIFFFNPLTARCLEIL